MIMFLSAAASYSRLQKGFIFGTTKKIQGTYIRLWSFKGRPLRETPSIHRFIDFATATPKDLEILTAACAVRRYKDETRCEPEKMDATNISVNLNPSNSGLVKLIEDELLRDEEEEDKVHIQAELRQLDICGNVFMIPPLFSPAELFCTSQAKIHHSVYIKVTQPISDRW
jgi:hypothetical protein